MKTTKQRLQELAAIPTDVRGKWNKPTIKEETTFQHMQRRAGQGAEGDIEMTVNFEKAAEYFQDIAKEMGLSIDYQMPDFGEKLANIMQEDLENWLGNNGAQWIEEGIESGVYDDLENK
jgi:hypothetical protein